jgi:hypothetical protein
LIVSLIYASNYIGSYTTTNIIVRTYIPSTHQIYIRNNWRYDYQILILTLQGTLILDSTNIIWSIHFGDTLELTIGGHKYNYRWKCSEPMNLSLVPRMNTDHIQQICNSIGSHDNKWFIKYFTSSALIVTILMHCNYCTRISDSHPIYSLQKLGLQKSL